MAVPSLLAVFSHPDDESIACGGLFALCAARGVRVSLLCLTRGEAGPGGPAETLGDVRTGELQEAARALGIHEVMVHTHEDGMLPWTDADQIEADILAAIERVRPNVVVTFDDDGLYGHPDHVVTHERTTAVLRRLGAAAPALHYVSMPRGAMRALVETASARPVTVGRGTSAGRDGERFDSVLGIGDPDAFGAMAPPPTLVLDVRHHAVAKLRALRCHRTQVAGTVLERLQERDAEDVLGVEHYRRANVGARGRSLLEDLGGAPAGATPD